MFCFSRFRRSFRSSKRFISNLCLKREPWGVNKNKKTKFCDYQTAMTNIHSDMKIYTPSGGGYAEKLCNELTRHAKENKLKNIEVCQLFPCGEQKYIQEGIFKNRILFMGAANRKAYKYGLVEYTPMFFSDVPKFLREYYQPDISFIQVTPPNKDGYCSLGITCAEAMTGIKSSKKIIAIINPSMPFVYGNGIIHISNIDYAIEDNYKIIEVPSKGDDVSDKIASLIAEKLIEDHSTVQVGIGSIPEAVLTKLTSYKDLGVHTEIFSDGIITLYNKGIITGKYKTVENGLITSTFALGTKKLYDFMNKNKDIALRDVDQTNNPFIISQNYKMVSINSAIEIDLTGQICSDSIGYKIYSGFGGQVDFLYGTSLCPNGKSVIALPSVTKRGESRITSILKPGAGVVTTRANARYVVTEYGIVDLFGKTIRERAKLLISIAHPDHRQRLYDEAVKLLHMKL